MNNEKKYIISREIAEKKLRRMSLEIVERNNNEPQLVLLGIKGSGIVIAGKIAAYLKEHYNGDVTVATLIIDKKNPAEIKIDPSMDFNSKIVILVDDVANSGKTMLYSLKPLLETFPKKIQTAALVERTHKSFPIALDYVGLSVSTTLDEHIFVEVQGNEVNGAWMESKM